MNRAVATVALVFALCSCVCGAQSLSYVDLVSRLTDLEILSVLPMAGESCAQWSSYDRASVYDETTGKYLHWDANGDGQGCIRREGDQFVFAEMDGPGCIWRIWSAMPKGGHVRIYLDGAEKPAVDLPFEHYFSREQSPFTYPALVYVAASGCNNYVPIPYQKSCKIVADRDWGKYFHFTYSTFPKDTVVPTFKRELSGQESLALSKANYLLSSRLGTDPAGRRSEEVTQDADINVPAGKSVSVARLRGPRAITAIRLDPGKLSDPWRILRSLVLRIRWDGESSPSVWCPLGDFFGSAPGINAFKALPLGMTKNEFYSYWYMPFAKSANIEIVNDSAEDVSLSVGITHAPLTRGADTLGRFHATWHRDAFLPPEPERRIDWTMLTTQGRGRYCGVMLHVFNKNGDWWGEGDEKFMVDGEKFPSTFGTGSEDYFGYAWCDPALFQNAYHNQTLNQNKNAGNVCVSRFHVADNVPFQSSFEAYIEKYFPNKRPTLYAATAYWYQAPGGKDPYTPLTVSERFGYFDYSIPGN